MKQRDYERKPQMNSLELTHREKEVLLLRLWGVRNKDIADELFLSEETISKHVRSILRKGKSRTFIELFMRRYVPEMNDPDFDPLPALPRSPRRRAKKGELEEPPVKAPHAVLVW